MKRMRRTVQVLVSNDHLHGARLAQLAAGGGVEGQQERLVALHARLKVVVKDAHAAHLLVKDL